MKISKKQIKYLIKELLTTSLSEDVEKYNALGVSSDSTDKKDLKKSQSQAKDEKNKKVIAGVFYVVNKKKKHVGMFYKVVYRNFGPKEFVPNAAGKQLKLTKTRGPNVERDIKSKGYLLVKTKSETSG